MKYALILLLTLAGCADVKTALKECGTEMLVSELPTAVKDVSAAISCAVETPGKAATCVEAELAAVESRTRPVVYQCALAHVHDVAVGALK